MEEVVAELGKRWPGNRVVNLVFHGHSVPAGYHVTPEVKPFDSYPLMTVARLKEEFPLAVLNGIVTAVGGENSVQGAVRFADEVLVMRPDVVFIDYGLNDRGLPIAEAEAAWRGMVRAAKERGIPVVLVTPTGAEDVRMGAEDEPLEVCAAMIRRVAEEEGAYLADVWAAWKAAIEGGVAQEELLSQINHPNRRGHVLVVDEIVEIFGVQ